MVFLAVINRFAPNRRVSKWRWVSIGSVLATAFWILASALFSFYVSNFGNYNDIYGSLATPIVLMTWLYLSSFLLLVGATVNAETCTLVLRF
jgi:membrane protein